MGGASERPAAEVAIDEGLVRALVRAQHPDLADLPLERLDSGWDNELFRLGDGLLVRLPRRAAAADLVASEQRWLPVLAPTLPLPVPVPLRTGGPTADYPWRWSIVAHLPGRSALHAPPSDPVAAARTLGTFLVALHRPAPPDAPANPYRGIPLAERDARTRGWIDQLADELDVPAVVAAWEAACEVARWDGPPVWLHGDLHPDNVIVDDGAIAGVVDFGDLTSGDPATDLVCGWMLFGPDGREVLREAVAADDATWDRARGWALTLGLAYLAHSDGHPASARCGRTAIAAVLSDPR